MFGISVEKAAEICSGRLIAFSGADSEIKRIITDSREAREGDLFLAYRGEKQDGHDYISSAFEKGALCALAEYAPEGAEGNLIIVDNVQNAVEKLIAFFLKSFNIPVLGVTGSAGKTTAKEMIAAVLGQKFRVFKTEKNLNSNVGLPITISHMEEGTELAVLELGISIPGEMKHRGEMTHPDVMVFTNIGHAHLEFLGDLEGVFREKTEIIKYMPENGTLIVNGDDEYLSKLQCPQKKLVYGLGENADVRALNISADEEGRLSFDICHEGRSFPVKLNAYGRHLVYTALMGYCAGLCFGLSPEEIIEGIKTYEVAGRRGAIVKTPYLTLVDDCYNSNLDSCRFSISSVMDLPGRHVLILGNILELGDSSVQQHRELGEFAKKSGAELVVGVGSFGKYISDLHFETKGELLEALPGIVQKGDNVLVKASLGMHLEEISEYLKKLS